MSGLIISFDYLLHLRPQDQLTCNKSQYHFFFFLRAGFTYSNCWKHWRILKLSRWRPQIREAVQYYKWLKLNQCETIRHGEEWLNCWHILKEQIGFTEAPNMKVGKRIKGDSSKFDLNELKDTVFIHQNRKSHGRRISRGRGGIRSSVCDMFICKELRNIYESD